MIFDKIINTFKPVFYFYYNDLPRASLSQFEVHLVEHCNLNCIGCNNFSPLAKKECIDVSLFESEIKRMGELFNGYVGRILLLGGEPLLHPQLELCMEIVRKYFPHQKILIVTNGLKLLSMKESFWNACTKYNIELSITKYPIIKNYNKIEKKISSFGVKYAFFTAKRHSMQKVPLDLNGCQNGNAMFSQCFKAGQCVVLRDNRIYTCTLAAHIHHFISYYSLHNFEVDEDSIDIFSHTRDEILSYLSKPIPMCRFCKMNCEERHIRWGISKKEKSEWI